MNVIIVITFVCPVIMLSSGQNTVRTGDMVSISLQDLVSRRLSSQQHDRPSRPLPRLPPTPAGRPLSRRLLNSGRKNSKPSKSPIRLSFNVDHPPTTTDRKANLQASDDVPQDARQNSRGRAASRFRDFLLKPRQSGPFGSAIPLNFFTTSVLNGRFDGADNNEINLKTRPFEVFEKIQERIPVVKAFKEADEDDKLAFLHKFPHLGSNPIFAKVIEALKSEGKFEGPLLSTFVPPQVIKKKVVGGLDFLGLTAGDEESITGAQFKKFKGVENVPLGPLIDVAEFGERQNSGVIECGGLFGHKKAFHFAPFGKFGQDNTVDLTGLKLDDALGRVC